MTETEKLSRVLFIANILYILSFILIIFEPDLFFEFAKSDGLNLYEGILYILATLSFAHWIFCLWFHSKFDRYSGNLIWLIIFNSMYAPFYYYQVLIKKRPLKNEILSEQEIEDRKRKNAIEEEDYYELMRSGIIEVIVLWASKDNQVELQKLNSEINITEELFSQWNDYNINKAEFLNEIFMLEERIAIKQFDKILNDKNELFMESYPELQEFITSDSWIEINNSAIETLKKINHTVGNKS